MSTVADAPKMPIWELWERYFQYCLRVRRTTEYVARKRRVYLDRLIEFIAPSDSSEELFGKLNRPAVVALLIDYAPRFGPQSRRNMHTTTRSFLRFAYEEGLTAEDLSGLVPSVRSPAAAKLPRALPPECIRALDESIERDCPLGLRDSAIVGILATYGARGVQVRRLRLVDIDWDRQSIHLPACKGGCAVDQFLTDEVGGRLADYIIDARPQSTCAEVFLDHRTAAAIASSSGMSYIIARRLQQADISVPEGVSHGTHGFRHAFGARMVGNVPFKDLTDMLGHRKPDTTLAYSKIDTDTLRLAALPWPGGTS